MHEGPPTGRAEAKAAEVEALTKQAEADESAAVGALAKVNHDYHHGPLTVEEWRGAREVLDPEHEGARAKLAQLRSRGAEVAAAAESAGDAEGDAVARVAEIRAAVAGEIEAAEGLAGVRVALLRMFEGFYVTRAPDREWEPGEAEVAGAAVAEIEAEAVAEGSQLISAPGWTIMPRPRPEVVEGIDEEWWPILKKDTKGLATYSLFEPFAAPTLPALAALLWGRAAAAITGPTPAHPRGAERLRGREETQ